MLKAIRYNLAAICLAASMGCLSLWWRSMTYRDVVFAPTYVRPTRPLWIDVYGGHVDLALGLEEESRGLVFEFQHAARRVEPGEPREFRSWRYFHANGNTIIFPLWYPALVFALAAVAAIRIRRFTLRSALVGTSVVAGLLGMVVAL
ncbi:hypothetical protein [Lacipirellula sp.]|uniref:hypothetical protein n=1 Tax=Lacipirellula sp. TaxID=2691419 RepID=UPI003D09F2C4